SRSCDRLSSNESCQQSGTSADAAPKIPRSWEVFQLKGHDCLWEFAGPALTPTAFVVGRVQVVGLLAAPLGQADDVTARRGGIRAHQQDNRSHAGETDTAVWQLDRRGAHRETTSEIGR